MTETEKATRRGGGWDREEDDLEAPRPFLGPLIRALRPYRRIVRGALGLAALLVLAGGLAAWVILPVEKTASLEFHVDFDGVGSGTYPNGARFSAEDFLTEPVVRRVYEADGLEKYGKYEKFRASLAVTSVNSELDVLEREYKGRLADTKLQPPDRMKLEREFREKAAALKMSAFKLTMLRRERFREMDRTLVEKVLRDTLAAWADDAAKVRGAMKYDLPIYSPAMLQKEFLESEDYLISADLLRRKVIRLIASLDLLMKVPGIQVYRLPGSGASLPEIKLRLEDVGMFRIAPALGLIRSSGLSRNPAATARYIEDRLFETTREQKLAQDQEGKVRGGLEAYVRTGKSMTSRPGAGSEGTPGGNRDLGGGMVIPQLGESFIDRLMDLSDSKGDTGFRKDLTERMITSGLTQAELASEVSYYKELESSFKSVKKPTGSDSARAEALKDIQTRFTAIIAEVEKSLGEVRQIYDLISVRNLQPASALYATEKPIDVETTSAFSFVRYLALAVLFVAFVGVATAAGALLHARFGGARA